MLVWILFLVCSIFVYVKILKPNQYWKNKNVPYVQPWPIFGNMQRIVFRFTSFSEYMKLYYHKYKTRYFGIYQFSQPTLVVKDLDLIKQITVKDFDFFVDHRNFAPEGVDPLLLKNLFILKGQKWRHMRATLSPAFTSSKMRAMFVLISECSEQFTNYFIKQTKNDAKPIILEMKDTFTRFASDIIGTVAFGIKCDSIAERNNEFYLMGKEATNFTGIRNLRFFGYLISPFLMKMFMINIVDNKVENFFRDLVKNTIATREKHGIIRPDMIHLLMEARKGRLKYDEGSNKNNEVISFAMVEESDVGKLNKSNQIELSDDDITAQALLFFIAGFDTVSTLMCFMSYELALNPEIQKRLQNEIDETLKECNGKVTYEAIAKMKYMDMVTCESLRKWPPASNSDRMCTTPYTIPPKYPHEIPVTLNKGDLIWIPVFCIHRDPKYYPDPEKFDPERFNDENKKNIHSMIYIPFGVGPRNCIGSRLALLETKTIFVYLLSKFDIVVNDKTQIPIKLSRSSFNMNAEKGFWLTLKPRKN